MSNRKAACAEMTHKVFEQSFSWTYETCERVCVYACVCVGVRVYVVCECSEDKLNTKILN